MKNFIINNWFKLLIVILLIFFGVIYLLNSRYYFMQIEGNTISQCDKFTGQCELKSVKYNK